MTSAVTSGAVVAAVARSISSIGPIRMLTRTARCLWFADCEAAFPVARFAPATPEHPTMGRTCPCLHSALNHLRTDRRAFASAPMARCGTTRATTSAWRRSDSNRKPPLRQSVPVSSPGLTMPAATRRRTPHTVRSTCRRGISCGKRSIRLRGSTAVSGAIVLSIIQVRTLDQSCAMATAKRRQLVLKPLIYGTPATVRDLARRPSRRAKILPSSAHEDCLRR